MLAGKDYNLFVKQTVQRFIDIIISMTSLELSTYVLLWITDQMYEFDCIMELERVRIIERIQSYKSRKSRNFKN